MGRLVGCAAWQAGQARRGYRTILIGLYLLRAYSPGAAGGGVRRGELVGLGGGGAVGLRELPRLPPLEHGALTLTLTSRAPTMSTPALTTTHT